MSKFHVGEIAIDCCPIENASPNTRKYTGEEVEIIELGAGVFSGVMHTVKHADGQKYYIKEIYLKKLPPHTDPSTWEELKDIYVPKELTF